MATATTNLGLVKPAYTDLADVGVINSNMDAIDAAYGALSEPVSGWARIGVYQVTGALPDDTASAVPSGVRPCLIVSRNGSMALYW